MLACDPAPMPAAAARVAGGGATRGAGCCGVQSSDKSGLEVSGTGAINLLAAAARAAGATGAMGALTAGLLASVLDFLPFSLHFSKSSTSSRAVLYRSWGSLASAFMISELTPI